MLEYRALSVRQPWAHAIVHLGKTLENRTRHNAHRGPLLIHASAGMDDDDYDGCLLFCRARGLPAPPAPAELPRGGIVGLVQMVDSVEDGEGNPWWIGPRAFVLRNARPLPFLPCRGTVTPLLWRPDAETQRRVVASLR